MTKFSEIPVGSHFKIPAKHYYYGDWDEVETETYMTKAFKRDEKGAAYVELGEFRYKEVSPDTLVDTL